MLQTNKLTNTKESTIYAIVACILLVSVSIYAYTDSIIALGIPFAIGTLAWSVINWRSLYLFFILLIPISPMMEIGGNMHTIPVLPFLFILTFVLICVLCLDRKRISKSFLNNPIFLVIVLQFVWLVVAVIFSKEHVVSVKYLVINILQLCSYLILPAILIKTKEDIFQIFRMFVIPMVLLSTLIFLRHLALNFGFYESNVVVQPFFYNHVDQSTLLSMVLPTIIVAYALIDKKRFFLRLFILALIPFLFVCVYIAFARAAMIAVLFAVIVNIAIRMRLGKLIMPVFFVFAFSVVGYMVKNNNYINFRPNYTQTYTREDFTDLIKATFAGGDMSSMERLYRWVASARMSTDEPLTGVGPNNFYYYYKPYTVSMFQTYVSRNPERSTTHNYFIFMLVEQGWPAMILYGILLTVVFAQAQNIFNRTTNKTYRNITLAAVMVIAAFFINNLFSELLQTFKISAFFYLAIIALILMNTITKKEQQLALEIKNKA